VPAAMVQLLFEKVFIVPVPETVTAPELIILSIVAVPALISKAPPARTLIEGLTADEVKLPPEIVKVPLAFTVIKPVAVNDPLRFIVSEAPLPELLTEIVVTEKTFDETTG